MAARTDKYYLEDTYPEFFRFLREGKVNISYSEMFRSFSITLDDSAATQRIEYCPWSGKKFPPDLRNEYFDTLENEFNFDEATLDDILEKRVPIEMQSEEWWIKRGL